MEINNTAPQAVSVKPDKAEKWEIIWRYTKVAAVIVLNFMLFNYVLRFILYLCCGIAMGETSSFKAMYNSYVNLRNTNELFAILTSAGLPILSEIISITFGAKLLKIDLKSLINRDGYDSATLVKSGVASVGLQMVTAIIVAIAAFVLNLFGLEASSPSTLGSQTSASYNLILYLYASFVGPILEELLYRGIVLQGLRKYNERMAIIISALIFGLMHQNYQQFVLGFIMGLLFAVITLKSGSIIPAMFSHFFTNSTSVLFTLLMMNSDYSTFSEILRGNSMEALNGSTAFIILTMVNVILHIGALIAGGIIIIAALAKKTYLKKPTPAGKSRGWSIMAITPLWYGVFIFYIYIALIKPFLK